MLKIMQPKKVLAYKIIDEPVLGAMENTRQRRIVVMMENLSYPITIDFYDNISFDAAVKNLLLDTEK